MTLWQLGNSHLAVPVNELTPVKAQLHAAAHAAYCVPSHLRGSLFTTRAVEFPKSKLMRACRTKTIQNYTV
jgi:hypothetical protein